jgi:arabinofuranosyltransferase
MADWLQQHFEGSAAHAALALAAFAAVLLLFFRNALDLAFTGDDAFIAFRYARHLADGLGLVWNPGERVEGFSSLSWVGIVAAGMRLGVDPEALTHQLGLASGVVILVALVAYSKSAFGRLSWLSLVAPLLLALNRSFVGWSTGGLETQFFGMLVALGCFAFLREREVEDPTYRSPYLFFAATLTRPEGPLFFAVAALFLLADVVRRRRSPAALLRFGLPYVALLGALLLWRYSYFGYWLPNTFYAKVPGLWFDQGFRYLGVFASEYRILWLGIPVLALLGLRRRFEHLFLAATIAAYVAYVAAIGGDRFEFRFMVVLLPLFYWLFASSLAEVARSSWLADRHRYAPIAAAVALAVFGTFPGRMISPARVQAEVVPIGLEAIEHTRAFAEGQRERALQMREIVEQGLLPDDLRIGTRAAGVFPYFTGFYTVDIWGLSDTFVAHEVEPTENVPAHRKEAPHSYLVEKRLDMIEAENGFVRPLEGFPVRTFCRGAVRCIKAGPYLLLFETTLGPLDFAKRFARFEIVH